jgi:hypothetical protein
MVDEQVVTDSVYDFGLDLRSALLDKRNHVRKELLRPRIDCPDAVESKEPVASASRTNTLSLALVAESMCSAKLTGR